MKIRKQALIDAIDTALADQQSGTERYQSALARKKKEMVDEWSAEALPQWRALRDHLTKALKSGAPELFREQAIRYVVTGSNGASLPFHNDYALERLDRDQVVGVGNELVHRPRGIDTERLRALKAALNAIVEDELSDTQLSRMGFSTPGWIFTAAVANSGGAK